ncbi:hypothetical protein HDU86_007692 [Geranomyces michiganensis]|nr:hypothetical protein HDU86_007692 [Geranomyces michiganensis]
MKIKRQKTNKRHMAVYLNSFGFREPYQCLVDGNFIANAMHMGVGLDELLVRVLTGPTKPMTTSCVQTELRKLGPDYSAVVDACASLERRRCQHAPAIPAAKCITEIIGEKNKHNYCVATQDTSLRRTLAAVPGTPLIYINRSVVILEPPSGATINRVKEIEHGKTLPQKFEKSVLHKPTAPVPEIPPHKKKPKAPNPLSIRKKKPEAKSAKTTTETKGKSPSKRPRSDDESPLSETEGKETRPEAEQAKAQTEAKVATQTKRSRSDVEKNIPESEANAARKDGNDINNDSSQDADEQARKKRKRRKKAKTAPAETVESP